MQASVGIAVIAGVWSMPQQAWITHLQLQQCLRLRLCHATNKMVAWHSRRTSELSLSCARPVLTGYHLADLYRPFLSHDFYCQTDATQSAASLVLLLLLSLNWCARDASQTQSATAQHLRVPHQQSLNFRPKWRHGSHRLLSYIIIIAYYHISSQVSQFNARLQGHSVDRIYFRQRSSDGSVNKTILKPRLALLIYNYIIYIYNMIIYDNMVIWCY